MLRLTRAQALAALASATGRFDAVPRDGNPFASLDWQLCFLRDVATDDWTIHAPGLLAAGAPLTLMYATADAPDRWFALANYYTALYPPLLGATDAEAADHALALVDAVVADRPRPATLRLAPLDAESPAVDALRRAFAERGWMVRSYPVSGNWHLPCDGMRFADYCGMRDGRLGKLKRFAKVGQVEIVTAPADVDRAMDAYERIYAKSWKRTESHPGFIRNWVRACAVQGWLRLGLAVVDGTTVAAQIWCTLGRRASIFKMAYDEDHAKLSVGSVLTAAMIRHALDVDRVAEIDYLSGDDAYKQSWMTHRRQRIGLVACNLRTIAGIGAAAVELAGQAKARLRAARSLPSAGAATVAA